MKKILKVSAIIILVLILILALVPFFFQDQIEQNLKDNINKNLNAKVEWSDLNLSLLADFPNAEVSLENVSPPKILNCTWAYFNCLVQKVLL
jgi:uncharacterized protein involved in outer membrane biogenesis